MNTTHEHKVSHAYTEEVRTAIEADFLLLDNDRKNTFLSAYGLDKDNADFTAATLPQMWSMEIFILKNLSIEELSRRMWIIREKFRLQAGETVYASYTSRLPGIISDESLQQGLSAESYPLLKEDAVNIARQMQRMNYYRVQRNIEINAKKELPIVIFFILVVVGTHIERLSPIGKLIYICYRGAKEPQDFLPQRRKAFNDLMRLFPIRDAKAVDAIKQLENPS